MNSLPISARVAFAAIAAATMLTLLNATLTIAEPQHSRLMAKAQLRHGTQPSANAAIAVALNNAR